MSEKLSAEGFRRQTDVSRETLERFEIYLAHLRHWQKRLNLVGASTLEDPWRRHFLDSTQISAHVGPAGPIVDLGSGAGFPGMVLAILGIPDVHLIEADQRKAAFLRETARLTSTKVAIHGRRVEAVDPFPAGTIVARAFAPLPFLLAASERFLGPGTIAVFLKGRRVEEELTAAAEHWTMQVERIRSVSDPSGTLLRLGTIARERR